MVGTMIGASQNLRGRGSQTFDGFFSNVRNLTAIERDLHRSSQNGLNSGFGVKGEGSNAVGTSCTFLESVCEMAVARRLPVTLEASQVQLGCPNFEGLCIPVLVGVSGGPAPRLVPVDSEGPGLEKAQGQGGCPMDFINVASDLA